MDESQLEIEQRYNDILLERAGILEQGNSSSTTQAEFFDPWKNKKKQEIFEVSKRLSRTIRKIG